MKKIVFLLLSFSGLVHVQGQIINDTQRNWEELIPLVTGGKSIQVSHVNRIGAPGAFCTYRALNGELGLSGGIFMSTGNVVGINYFQNSTSPHRGVDNGTPGHPLLNQLSGNYTYNASGIEFDFSSPVDDTLQLRFIFASEEYKEYVGSQYNDVFGFYVTQGPGITSPVNIAVLPDGTPVTINTINHISNSGYYIDNDSTNAAPVEFDGLITITTSAFPMVADSTYHIQLLIADASDGIYDSGVFLEVMQGTQASFCGEVRYEGLPAGPGWVEAFGYSFSSATAYFYAADSSDASGHFTLQNLPYGAYILRSTLDPSTYPLATSMYLDSAQLWQDARIVYIPTLDTLCEEFDHREFISSGPGEVSGFVYRMDEDKSVVLHPGEDRARVLALNENGRVVSSAIVHSDGSYTLRMLPYGSCRIIADLPFYALLDTITLELSPGLEQVAQINFIADAQELSIRALNNPAAQPGHLFDISVFPNPCDGVFGLGLTGDESLRNFQVRVSDMTGRIIYQSAELPWPHDYLVWQVDLSANAPAAGVYLLNVSAGGTEQTTKLVIR